MKILVLNFVYPLIRFYDDYFFYSLLYIINLYSSLLLRNSHSFITWIRNSTSINKFKTNTNRIIARKLKRKSPIVSSTYSLTILHYCCSLIHNQNFQPWAVAVANKKLEKLSFLLNINQYLKPNHKFVKMTSSRCLKTSANYFV